MERQIKNRKQDIKGITLISLVVTIVVLLILAGVSISMLSGENGIVRQAVESKENTRGASAKEEIDLWISNVKIDNLIGTETAEEQEELLDRLVGNGTLKQEEADKLNNGETITIGKSEISLDGTTGGSGNSTVIPGKTYETETDIKVDGTPITVPGGATISGIEGEYENPDEGIVIYIIPEGEPEITDWNADRDSNGIIDVQEKYDQFVWVPVPNPVAAKETELISMMNEGKYPIAVAIDGTDANGLQNYRGALYDFAEDTDAEGNKYVKITAKEWSVDSTSNREPAYLTNNNYADASSYNNVGITEDLLQEEYNKMVERVKSKKGFWVGRYETSNMTSNNANDLTQQISVIKGTTIGISGVDWYRMYAQQKNYSKLALEETTSSTSSMIWGSQWDQIMIWMKEEPNERVTTNGNYFVTNSVGYGNYKSISGAEEYDTAISTSDPAATGSSEYFKAKNIYDLAGNIMERSLEAQATGQRILRGGDWKTGSGSYSGVICRLATNPNYSYIGDGSRTTLY